MLQCSISLWSGTQVSVFTSQKSFRQSMLKATKLTGMGKLMDATRVIQRTLFGTTPQPTARPTAHGPTPTSSSQRAEKSPPSVIILPSPHGYQPTPLATPAPPASSAPSGRKASFSKHNFTFEGDSYPYRIYIPSATDRKSVV